MIDVICEMLGYLVLRVMLAGVPLGSMLRAYKAAAVYATNQPCPSSRCSILYVLSSVLLSQEQLLSMGSELFAAWFIKGGLDGDPALLLSVLLSEHVVVRVRLVPSFRWR